MTDLRAVTQAVHEVTARDSRAIPALRAYAPGLTTTLPASVSAASGPNALAQAVVNVATDMPNPGFSGLAEQGIRLLGLALHAVVSEPDNVGPRAGTPWGFPIIGGSTPSIARTNDRSQRAAPRGLVLETRARCGGSMRSCAHVYELQTLRPCNALDAG